VRSDWRCFSIVLAGVAIGVIATLAVVEKQSASAAPLGSPAAGASGNLEPADSRLSPILPPDNPAENIAPQPDFLNSCSGWRYDDSSRCVGATLQAIANARHSEGLGPMTLPSNWYGLGPSKQLYVATNLERTARGLAPLAAMSPALDQAAEIAADAHSDPGPPGGFGYTQWGSNWAGAVGNALEAMYFWMYDDGPRSSNIECTPADSAGCWGHRDNVLLALPCADCIVGSGFAPAGYRSGPSWAEILVEATQVSSSSVTSNRQ
jgi:hypothetical protein